MKGTFAQRLRQARIRAELSLQELCDKVNEMAETKGMSTKLTRQAISNYEQGLRMPNDEALQCISKALNQEIKFFFAPMMFDREEVKISYRQNYANVSELKAMKENVLDEVERHLEISDILGETKREFDNVTVDKVLATRRDMIDCAKKVREAWGLSKNPITNTQALLWEHGIRVIMFDGPKEVDGLCVTVEGRPMVALNKDVEMVERRRMTAMHELAHILFNDNFDEELTKGEKERLCQYFASEMLLPESLVLERCVMKQNVSLTELFFWQSLYGIAVEDLITKMMEMGIITEKRYRTYTMLRKNSTIQKAIDRSRFMEGDVSMFEAQVYRALACKLITLNKAASLLKTSEQKVQNKFNKF